MTVGNVSREVSVFPEELETAILLSGVGGTSCRIRPVGCVYVVLSGFASWCEIDSNRCEYRLFNLSHRSLIKRNKKGREENR